jgi:hypothetical protein
MRALRFQKRRKKNEALKGYVVSFGVIRVWFPVFRNIGICAGKAGYAQVFNLFPPSS